jgi:hypothetical protein
VPREIFPTGKKTARYGLVVRRAGSNRPLEPIAMEWGFPTKVASKRDPAVKLDKFVTNARNLIVDVEAVDRQSRSPPGPVHAFRRTTSRGREGR